MVVLVLASCYQPSPATGVPCAANGDCPGDQVCDFGTTPPICGGAVGDARRHDGAGDGGDAGEGCSDSIPCPSIDPVCDATSHTCRGCVADAECGVGACTEYDGLCVADRDTIYVDPRGADAGTCTNAQPCATPQYALGQVAGTRRTIRMADGAYTGNGVPALSIDVTGERVVISGERASYTGAMLTVTTAVTAVPVVQTSSGTDVVLEGLTIHGASIDGVRSAGALLLSHVSLDSNAVRGLNAQTATGVATHIWDSRIANNSSEGVYAIQGSLEVLRTQVILNAQGGVEMRSGQATIVSSVIANNGGAQAQFGGVLLQNLSAPPVLAFDSIANNAIKNGPNTSAGVQADSSVPVAIASSILYGNIGGGGGSFPQLCQSCTATYTVFSGAAPSGAGNTSGDPMFVDPASYDYHVSASSLARDGADPASTVHYDVDGEVRPQGPGYDCGADEIP